VCVCVANDRNWRAVGDVGVRYPVRNKKDQYRQAIASPPPPFYVHLQKEKRNGGGGQNHGPLGSRIDFPASGLQGCYPPIFRPLRRILMRG
jgi:hypothetical protein